LGIRKVALSVGHPERRASNGLSRSPVGLQRRPSVLDCALLGSQRVLDRPADTGEPQHQRADPCPAADANPGNAPNNPVRGPSADVNATVGATAAATASPIAAILATGIRVVNESWGPNPLNALVARPAELPNCANAGFTRSKFAEARRDESPVLRT
jgi:hypothetical protein